MPGIVVPDGVDTAHLLRSALPTSPSCATIPSGARASASSTTRFATSRYALAVALEHDALDRRAAEVEAEVPRHRAVQPPSTVSTAPVTKARRRQVEHRAGDVLGRAEVAGERLQLGQPRADPLVACARSLIGVAISPGATRCSGSPRRA